VDRSDINAKVIAIFAQIMKMSKDAIQENVTLESLGADSLNQVQFIMDLEEAFGIEINDEDAEKLTTIAQTVDYIQRLKQAS
jgi:acyl carrier protein